MQFISYISKGAEVPFVKNYEPPPTPPPEPEPVPVAEGETH